MMCSLTKLDNTKKSELDECKYDLGGYFIINGGESVIISQKELLVIKYMFLNKIKHLQNIHILLKLNLLIY